MKINKTHNQQGFTLIELLVVITIIGILATVGVANFSGALSGSRDATRISNIKLLQTSLTSYYSDRGEYLNDDVLSEDTFKTKIKTYIGSSYPQDSKSGQPACWQIHDIQEVTPADGDGGMNCGTWYYVGPSNTGMTNGGYKLGTTFEKEANVFGTKSQTRTDGGTNDGLYELHDGGIGATITMGTGKVPATNTIKVQ